MQYMLTLYSEESGFKKMTKAEQEQAVGAYMAYTKSLADAGHLKASGRMAFSSAASTVRIVNGKTQVLDGPFIDTKEQLAGYYLIDVADLDAALSWAGRCPGASHGTIEVRPMWT